MALIELLRKAEVAQDTDFLREGVRVLSQALMELEVSQHLKAERYEHTSERTGQRNGYRERQWDTRVGTIELQVPRVRDGSFLPSLLEPRRRAEQALTAVVQEAYVHGVSTRRVDELEQALGMKGISKSQVSRLCETLDGEVQRFATGAWQAATRMFGWMALSQGAREWPGGVHGRSDRCRRQELGRAGSAGFGCRAE